MKTSFMKAAAWIAAGTMLGVVYLSGGRGDATQAAPAQARPRQVDDQGARAFWWKHMGEQSGACVWFGPLMGEPGSRTRFWTMSAVRPGSEAPLLCLQGEVAAWTDERVRLRVGELLIQIQPSPGTVWEDVRDEADLLVRTEGLY